MRPAIATSIASQSLPSSCGTFSGEGMSFWPLDSALVQRWAFSGLCSLTAGVCPVINFRGTRRLNVTCSGPRALTRAGSPCPSFRVGVTLPLCTPKGGTLPLLPLAASSPGGLLGERSVRERQPCERGPGQVVTQLGLSCFLFPGGAENGKRVQQTVVGPRAAGGRGVAARPGGLPTFRSLLRGFPVPRRISLRLTALSRMRSSISCRFRA